MSSASRPQLSPKLTERLPGHLILHHSLPCSVEHDWTVEIHDAKGEIILKCMTRGETDELISMATQYAERMREALDLAE